MSEQRAGTLARSWEDTQISVFTKWCNVQLATRNMSIESVVQDFYDGVKLINLLEAVSGKYMTVKWHQAPKQKIQMIENCNIAVSFITDKMGIKLVGIGGSDIYDKSTKLTLGLIWSVISHTHLDAIMKDAKANGQSSKEALLKWCRDSTQGYPGVEIGDFDKSWTSGLAFSALVNRYVPQMLDYSSMDKSNQVVCLETAFDAMKKLGLNVYLETSDLVGVEKPDEKAVITQVAELYRFLTDEKLMTAARGRLFKTQTINEKIVAMINESSGEVQAALIRMREGLRPLLMDNMKYCPLCERLFVCLCDLYDIIKSLSKSCSEKVEAVKKVAMQLDAKQCEIDAMKMHHEQEIARLKASHNAQLAALREQLEASKSGEIAKLIQENENLKRDLQEKSAAEISHRDAEIENLREQLRQARLEAEQSPSNEASELRVIIKNRDKLIQGLKFEYGHGTLKNDLLAFTAYRSAAEAKDAEGYFSVARCFERGAGTPQNLERAAQMYQLAIDLGHHAAMNNLASMKLNGRGINQDEAGAAKMFKVAADNGVAAAQCNYAVLLDSGRGVERNPVEAARYLKLAAESGHPRAKNNLAVKLENGNGVTRDEAQSRKLLREAAAAGHPTAMFNMGVVSKDRAEALQHWKKAGDAGHLESMNNYAVALINGDGLPKSEERGAAIMKAAAEKGCAESVCNYGLLMMQGRGTEKNLRGAMRLFKMASEKGSSFGMTNLAVQLAQGINVKQNLQEAVMLMKNAADRGEAMAQFNYALMLHFGIGVQKNEVEANRYFRYAARLGIKEALQFIAHDRRMTL